MQKFVTSEAAKTPRNQSYKLIAIVMHMLAVSLVRARTSVRAR
jgi:hypothetical protein